jgi:hypothetical protein
MVHFQVLHLDFELIPMDILDVLLPGYHGYEPLFRISDAPGVGQMGTGHIGNVGKGGAAEVTDQRIVGIVEVVPVFRQLYADRIDSQRSAYRLFDFGKDLERIVYSDMPVHDPEGPLQFCVRAGMDSRNQGRSQISVHPVGQLTVNDFP